ncbi:MAG: long-chain fatty acid--CoA ligase [Mariprofundaceae bacterium]
MNEIIEKRLVDIRGANSLPEAFFACVAVNGKRPAQWRRGKQGYAPITYEQMAMRVRRVANGLLRAGIEPGDRVALLMENVPEWAVVDYAVLAIGAVTVPLYCSYRAQDMSYVVRDAGARLVITSGGKLLRTLLAAMDSCPDVAGVYALHKGEEDGGIKAFSELEAGEVDEAALDARLQALDRETLATLVYTSGTTGNPKGVMLSHGNIMANLEALDFMGFEPSDKMLSFLPLAHCFERMGGHFLPYSYGLTVAFAERPDTVAKNLGEAQPTILISVPRLFEVIRSRMLGQVAKQSGLKQFLFHAYIDLAGRSRRGGLSWFGGVRYHLLDRLVGEKVRQRFGGRLRMLVSGGAPLSVEVGEFFDCLGLPIVEGYGMTEASPLISANPPVDRRLGSVGKPVAGVTVRIADDGEIIVQGANVMQGYWHLPEATAETVIDGWLHTGDIGVIDEDGYLHITDRKKDLIVDAGGENIAPQRIESQLSGDELIEQVVVYGDRHAYLVAMVIPNREAAESWGETAGLPASDWDALVSSPILRKELQTRISARLKGLNAHEQVRRICVRGEPFSMEDGLLTPTMKVKRRKVYECFRDDFEKLYESK